jgi:hypothetical protein
MIENTGDQSFYHESIAAWIAAGGDFTVEGQSLVKSKPAMTERNGLRVFDRHFNLEHDRWVKLAVSLLPRNQLGQCFATMGYGHTGTIVPKFWRRNTSIQIRGFVIDLDTTDGGMVVHGQGSSSVHFPFDFETRTVGTVTTSKDETKNVPHDGNQTGGHWPYMQVTTPLDTGDIDDWRRRLYAHARYGGRFVHKDTGIVVTESDWPKAVLQDGTHFHRDTKTWIEYTHPSEPWRDKGDMRTADDQHFSVYDALCEVYTEYPWDEGLRWEVIFAANRFLFQIPGHDKGTYQWDPGQARAMGRIPKFASKCVPALFAAGESLLAKQVGIRSAQRLNNQVNEFRDAVVNGRVPWPNFEGRGKHSPAEIGIWWWGLDAARKMFATYGVEFLDAELRYMMNVIARFCFDSFFWKDGRLELPYYVRTDDTHPRSPSGGRHFAWLAARHADVLTLADEKKMDYLIGMGEGIQARFKGDLA